MSLEKVEMSKLNLEPALEYLHGYPVTETSGKTITFENGAKVVNSGPQKLPKNLVGKSLATTIIHPANKEQAGKTRLIFSHFENGLPVGESVEVEMSSFKITDPRFEHPPASSAPQDEEAQEPDPREATQSNIHSVEIFEGNDEWWYYRVKAGNGQTLSTSEGYTRKETAVEEASKAYPEIEPLVVE